MTAKRRLSCLLAAAALLPVWAAAQEAPYPPPDGQQGAYQVPPPPPDEGPAGYGTGPYGEANVDVSVDLATPGAQVSFETFRDGLSPYGEWVTVGGYGRVWRPARVAAGWRPYYYGRWEWTDEGWLWVSDEPWGWAAYHYGRWGYDTSYGWFWIPGYQWAPAWVTWRYGPEYIGWAPLGPGFSVYVTSYPIAYGWWTFVPCHRFAGVPVWNVAYAGAQVRGIFHGTQPAPPRAAMFGVRGPAWGGPARPFVEQRIGRPIPPVRVQAVASPSALSGAQARAGVVPIYRPEVRVPPGRAVLAPIPAPPRPTVVQPGGVAGAHSATAAPAGRAVGGAPAAAPARPMGAAPAPWPGRVIGGAPAPAAAGGAAIRPAPAPGRAIQQGTPQGAPRPQSYQGAPRGSAPGAGAAPNRGPAPQGAPGAGAPRPYGGSPQGEGGGGGHAPAPHRR